MNRSAARRRAGFTLVEMLIVITAMAILAAVTLPQLSSSTLECKEANGLGNLAVVRQAIEHYRIDHHDVWPTEDIQTQLTTKTDLDGQAGTRFGPYLRQQFPLNPVKDSRSMAIVETMPVEAEGPEAWVYCPATGDLRLNMRGTGPSGVAWFSM